MHVRQRLRRIDQQVALLDEAHDGAVDARDVRPALGDVGLHGRAADRDRCVEGERRADRVGVRGRRALDEDALRGRDARELVDLARRLAEQVVPRRGRCGGLARERRRRRRHDRRCDPRDERARERVGLALVVVVGARDTRRRDGGGALLLRDVRDLVRDQLDAGGRCGIVGTGGEVDVVTDRERAGVELRRDARGVGAGVDAHVRKIGGQLRREARGERAGQASAAADLVERGDRGVERVHRCRGVGAAIRSGARAAPCRRRGRSAPARRRRARAPSRPSSFRSRSFASAARPRRGHPGRSGDGGHRCGARARA